MLQNSIVIGRQQTVILAEKCTSVTEQSERTALDI